MPPDTCDNPHTETGARPSQPVNTPPRPPVGQPDGSQPGGGKAWVIVLIIVVGVIAVTGAVLTFLYFKDNVELAKEIANDYKRAEEALGEMPDGLEHEMPDGQEPDEAVMPEEEAAPEPGAPVWHNGRNVLIGTFNFDGNKYGFTVTLNYSESTGRASDCTFEAHGYGGVSKISTAVISDDGTSLYVKGTASGSEALITASAPEGSSTFTGFMKRGDHEGSCTLTLQ